MEITDKKRDEATHTWLSKAVDKVISLINDLINLNGWWYIEYRWNKRNDNNMLYGMYRCMFSDVDIVSNLDLQNSEVFDLRLGRPGISDFNILCGSIKLVYEKSSNFAVYRFTRDSLSVLGVSEVQMISESIVFEYPPRSFASVLFFMVNPEVEKFVRKFVRKIAEQQQVSEEEREALITWEYVYDRVRETKIDREITFQSNKLPYINDLVSRLEVSSSSKYKSLSMIGTTSLKLSDEYLYKLFVVILRKKNEKVVYYIENKTGMFYFFNALLPRSDVVALSEDASTLLPSVRKVPILIKVLEQLDDEWFTKPMNLLSKWIHQHKNKEEVDKFLNVMVKHMR
ncbi:MAG: hypothetical protein QXJ97_01430 [Desulfurococcaceae archaeon]